MKAMVYHGNRDLRLETVPDPSPTEGEALLKVDYCGICATDIEEYVYGPKFIDNANLPIITGHEVTATVVDLPHETDRLSPGTRVALNTVLTCDACFWCGMGETQQCEKFTVVGFDRDGGLAEYLTWPADELIPLPDSVSSEAAALIEPSGVAHHCVQRAGIRPGETVAVVGAGTVGTLAVQIAKAQGARVFAVDVKQMSLDLASHLGAEVAINAAEEDAEEILKGLTEGRGPGRGDRRRGSAEYACGLSEVRAERWASRAGGDLHVHAGVRLQLDCRAGKDRDRHDCVYPRRRAGVG